MPSFSTLTLVSLSALAVVNAHMSPWTPSMYGVGPGFSYDAGNPVDPIPPDQTEQDSWWFRGPAYRALAPAAGNVTELKAGGTVTLEIACHVAWTSYGSATTVVGSDFDACPGNTGALHTGDPEWNPALVSGCALAIADVDDIEKVTWDNLAIFTVQKDCVVHKMTSFEVPAAMPACTGDKCICGWFWLANKGTANFYMTAFDCAVTGSPSTATPIHMPLVDPVYCDPTNSTCTLAKGAKRPIYAYNTPSNVPWYGNDNRAGYHSTWSFEDGAQNDIFEKVASTSQQNNAASTVNTIPASSSSVAEVSTTAEVTTSTALAAETTVSSVDSTKASASSVKSTSKHLNPPTTAILSTSTKIVSTHGASTTTTRGQGHGHQHYHRFQQVHKAPCNSTSQRFHRVNKPSGGL